MVEDPCCMYRLVEKCPSHLTVPLLTSDNHNADSETGSANSHFGMMPQSCSHIVDTRADSSCIHQLMLTASLVPRQLIGSYLIQPLQLMHVTWCHILPLLVEVSSDGQHKDKSFVSKVGFRTIV